jgi:hypothetical protein
VTCEARRGLWSAGCGGFWEGWIVGACGAIQSSWSVPWPAWAKFSTFGVQRSRGPAGRSGDGKGRKLCAVELACRHLPCHATL